MTSAVDEALAAARVFGCPAVLAGAISDEGKKTGVVTRPPRRHGTNGFGAGVSCRSRSGFGACPRDAHLPSSSRQVQISRDMYRVLISGQVLVVMSPRRRANRDDAILHETKLLPPVRLCLETIAGH